MPRTLSLAIVLLATHGLGAAPPASAVAYHPRGTMVAVGSTGEVRLFDPATGQSIRRLTITGRVTAVTFDPTGTWLAVAAGEAGKTGIVSVYPVGAGAGTERIWKAHSDAVYAIAFTPDGKSLATAGYDRVIRIWEINGAGTTGNQPDGLAVPKRELKDHSDTVYGLAFHPGGTLLASAAADRAVKVWDVTTGTRLYTLSEPTDWLHAVAWSPDGTHLAAAGVDKSIRVWQVDRTGGKLLHAVFAHEQPVWRLAYTGDGKTLYSAGEDRIIKAWDAAKMVETKVFPAQPDTILGFAVRPDGKQLAVGRFDGTAILIDSTTNQPTAQLLPIKPLPPKAEALAPKAATRGKITRLVVTGKNLDHATRVTANLPGIEAKLTSPGSFTDRVEIDVTVPPSAPVGAAQLIFEGPAGKSAPLTLAIDRHTAVAESGVTDSTRAAMTVTLPATVAGSIDRAGGIDFFRFEATAGQPIGVQVVAAELGSKLDPVLVLTDSAGQPLAEGGAVLGYTIPRAGTYAVGIRDREYRGAADMTYRLHIGDVPVVTGVFPLAVQRGKTATVHVDGVHLGSPTGLTVSVTVPADAALGSRIPLPLPTGGEKPLGLASVVVGEFHSVVIDPAAGGDIHVPGSADGILLKSADAQVVRFAAKKGERLIVETLARRAGSPVDTVIEILDTTGKPVPRAVLRSTAKLFSTFRDHDSAGSGIRLESWNDLAIDHYLYVEGELMRVFALPKGPDDDCQFYQVNGQRVGFLDTTPSHHSQGGAMYKVEIHPPGTTFPPNGLPVFPIAYRNDDGGPGYGKDSRIMFDPPADGIYQVRVTDARGAGGPTHAYRVTVRPPRPDYSINFNPTAPSVWKGGAVPVNVSTTRLDGFDGPIHLTLEGLPKGFHAPATVIEGNLTGTAFALFAPADAVVPPNTQIKLVAKAMIGGKEVVREVIGGLPKVIEPGDIVTTTRQNAIVIRPGQETRLVVDIERRGDFKGRVPVEVRGLPHGVRVLDIGLNGILVTERDTSREIVLSAEPWVQPTEHPILIVARSERKGTEHAARAVLLKVEK